MNLKDDAMQFLGNLSIKDWLEVKEIILTVYFDYQIAIDGEVNKMSKNYFNK